MKTDCTNLHWFRARTCAALDVCGRRIIRSPCLKNEKLLGARLWLAKVARFFKGTQVSHKKALLTASLCLLSSVVWGATPPKSTITNTATAAYSIGVSNFTTNSTATVSTAVCNAIGIKIELLQYVPPAGAAFAPVGTQTEAVQPTGFAPGGLVVGPFKPVTSPTLQGNLTTLPANLLLSPMNDAAGRSIASYSRNEPVFIRVISYDANLNPATADQISVTLTTTASGDNEVLQLTETGISTGIFVGAVPSVFAAIGTAARPNDGQITVSSHNDTLVSLYNHTNCTSGATIVSTSSGLIDPYGVVFDSATGAPVNGATISKINLLTGLIATAYCNDGITVLPQPVISGSPTVCDATMDAGGYHFPLVPAGNYKLVVTPPLGYAFPSSAMAVNLPKLIGTPKVASVILGNPGANPGGSYGGAFLVWGSSLRIDLPIDPSGTIMTIQKVAGKAVVGIGEFIPYTLTLTNNSATLPIIGALIADHLPPGFRYQRGSARLNGVVIADPVIAADARTLTFKLDMAQAATVTLRYVLEVTPGARTGIAENIAAAIGIITSNTAPRRSEKATARWLFLCPGFICRCGPSGVQPGRAPASVCDNDLPFSAPQSCCHGCSGQCGKIVLFAQVCGDQVLEFGVTDSGCNHCGGFVGQMPEISAHAAFQEIGIGRSGEHVAVVVALQHQRVTCRKMMKYMGRRVAQVCHHCKLCRSVCAGDLQGFACIMGNGEGRHLHSAEVNPAAVAREMQAPFKIGRSDGRMCTPAHPYGKPVAQ